MYIYYVGGFTKSYEIECSKFHTNKKMGQLTFNYASSSHTALFSQVQTIQVVGSDLRVKFEFLHETVMLKDLYPSTTKHREECVRLMEHFNLKQIERNKFHELVTPAMVNYLTK